MRDTSKDSERIDRIWRWIHNNIPGEPRDDADIPDVVIRLLEQRTPRRRPKPEDVAQRHAATARITELESLLSQMTEREKWLRGRCRIVCYPLDGSYPIEYNAFAETGAEAEYAWRILTGALDAMKEKQPPSSYGTP